MKTLGYARGVVIAAACAAAGPALADAWNLVQTGSFRALAVNPAAPNFVYVATDVGVRRSDDGGATWSDGVGRLSSSVRQLVVDPVASSTVYAVSGSSVYRIVDRAASWSLLLDPGTDRRIGWLTIDRLTPSVLYAVIQANACIPQLGCYWLFHALEKSTDAGASWAELTVKGAIDSLSASGSNVYAATHAGGLFTPVRYAFQRSTDGGQSFEYATPPGGGENGVGEVVCDPGSPNVIYATSWAGLFRSSDGGSTWSAPADGLPVDANSVSVLAPGATQTIFVATAAGVFVSADGGDSWRGSLSLPDVTGLAVGARAGVGYAITPGGLYRLGSAPAGQCESTPTRLCLGGGRFAAEVWWRKNDGTTV